LLHERLMSNCIAGAMRAVSREVENA